MAMDPHRRRQERLDRLRGSKPAPKKDDDEFGPMGNGPPGRGANKLIFFVAAFIFIGVGYYGWDYVERYSAQFLSGANPSDLAQIQAGREIYYANCAYCHGDYLEGQEDWDLTYPTGNRPPVPLDATGPAPGHTDDLLFRIIKNGGQSVSPEGYRNTMPAYGSLLEDWEIWAVMSFIEAQWPADIRRQRDALQNK